jgi:AcrR family transcriptional regulator
LGNRPSDLKKSDKGLMEKAVYRESQVSRRERGKIDKRRRIREATRDVFRRKGYEAATTREIAELADVAIGTLFAYARDKRELLMMVINDDREALPLLKPSDAGNSTDLLGALMDLFEPRYHYWAREPSLSRLAVQQGVPYSTIADPGPELARFEAGRQEFIGRLAAFFELQQREGRISPRQSPSTIAWMFMSLYQGQVRKWLTSERPHAEDGLKELRALFSLALNGVTRESCQQADMEAPSPLKARKLAPS